MGTPVELKGIPESDVDRVINTLKAGGATNIQKKKEEDGTFTVTFEDPS